ncbi:MAG: NTP transferase domain-containing protein [Hyphomicrobium sp.]
MKIGAALLAAGRSQRFGDDDKLLSVIGGQPLIRRAIAAFEASSVAEIVVVTPIDADRLMAAGGQGRWRYVANPDAEDGMATSLRVGLSALGEDCAGALVALADMPYCSAAMIDDLCAAFAQANGEAIVFPENPDGRQGHPVLWPRRLFGDLLKVQGDKGGKAILSANRDAWHPVPIADETAFFDVDTASDLDAARKLRT